ncbi:hypothetical protein KIL84_015061 [Mauremys mutica]|uniref:Uncharacterized protein n=1 Tax=Mauremys mutica TaxID=74926 RepID=A0A9D3XSF9_9SAUR|nr:hypothetical protein KIL84_015061 [Mauremys mutica]
MAVGRHRQQARPTVSLTTGPSRGVSSGQGSMQQGLTTHQLYQELCWGQPCRGQDWGWEGCPWPHVSPHYNLCINTESQPGSTRHSGTPGAELSQPPYQQDSPGHGSL